MNDGVCKIHRSILILEQHPVAPSLRHCRKRSSSLQARRTRRAEEGLQYKPILVEITEARSRLNLWTTDLQSVAARVARKL